MQRLGLPRIVQSSGFPEHEVSSLYFEFVSLCRVLPTQPEVIQPPLWEYLVHCVQVMSALVNLAEKDHLERARENAIRKFLPQARDTVHHEYQQQCEQGTVELKLAYLTRHESSPDSSDELCREALRLERESRFESCRRLSTEGLRAHQAVIVKLALDYAHEAMATEPDQFTAVDLVIRLLDLLRSVLEPQQNSADTCDEAVERIVLGLGNLLYSAELGLGGIPAD